MNDHEALLARWCQEHDGIATLDDIRRLGLSAATVHEWARRGLLVREHEAVYRHAAHPRTFRTRLRAALEAVRSEGCEAFVSGPSLMRLHGVRGEWSEVPEVTIVGTKHLELPGVRIRRIDRLDPRDVRVHDGLPALAPPLGLLLLGATVSRWKVQTAVHDMVFLGLTKLSLLVDVYVRYRGRGRRGAKKFRQALRSLDPGGRATQTNLELGILDAIRARGAAEPHLQFAVVDGDGRKRRLDLAWPDRMLDVETDGDRFHTDPIAAAAMVVRDRALAAVGYRTVRVSASEWDLDRAACIRRILDALD